MASSSTSPPQGEAEAEDVRNWAELPRDVTAAILQRVGSIDLLLSAQKVCTAWRSIIKDPAMWRKIDMHNLRYTWDVVYDLEKMTRDAVDRSCGQLVDINIENFGTDELLMYIADRASELRCLGLVYCYDITDEGLCEAANKLPLLEELCIYYCSLSKETIETVGRCCPRLKSLKFGDRGYRGPHMECDEEALAIAESMPGLRELQLFGNKMTNDGLKAILDGCPQLESLDMRQCFNINLGGTLGKRCSEQIKKLRRPHDSTEDYAFDATVYDAHDDDSDDDEYPSGLSNIVDFLSDDDEYYEFSGGSDFYDGYEELFFGY